MLPAPSDHHVYVQTGDPLVFADLVRAVIRSDVRTGKAQPPATGVRFVPDIPGQDRYLTPAMLNAEGKGDCSSIPRAAGAFEPASHVGVLTTPDGFHAFLLDGSRLPPGVEVLGGKLSGVLPDYAAIDDPNVARGMNGGRMLPLPWYQAAVFVSLWDEALRALPSPTGAPVAQAAAVFAAGEGGEGRRHVPNTEAGRLVASVAAEARKLLGAGREGAADFFAALKSLASGDIDPARAQAAQGLAAVYHAGASGASDALGQVAGHLAAGPAAPVDAAHDMIATAVSAIHEAAPGVLPATVTDLIGTGTKPDDAGEGDPAAIVETLTKDGDGDMIHPIDLVLSKGRENLEWAAGMLEGLSDDAARALLSMASPEQRAQLAELFAAVDGEGAEAEPADLSGAFDPAMFATAAQGDPTSVLQAFNQRGQQDPAALFALFQHVGTMAPQAMDSLMGTFRQADPRGLASLVQLLRRGQMMQPSAGFPLGQALGSILGGGQTAGPLGMLGSQLFGAPGGDLGLGGSLPAYNVTIDGYPFQVTANATPAQFRAAMNKNEPFPYTVDDSLFSQEWSKFVAWRNANGWADGKDHSPNAKGPLAAPTSPRAGRIAEQRAISATRAAAPVSSALARRIPALPTSGGAPPGGWPPGSQHWRAAHPNGDARHLPDGRLRPQAIAAPAMGPRWWAAPRRQWAPPLPTWGNHPGGWASTDPRRIDPTWILQLLQQQQGDPVEIFHQYNNDGGDLAALVQLLQQQTDAASLGSFLSMVASEDVGDGGYGPGYDATNGGGSLDDIDGGPGYDATGGGGGSLDDIDGGGYAPLDLGLAQQDDDGSAPDFSDPRSFLPRSGGRSLAAMLNSSGIAAPCGRCSGVGA